ncbi:MAG: ABC transporter permease, partial [Muribaculaceae bacterium]|nr:ABC transporter permease [Muribaculaceae bacterium]
MNASQTFLRWFSAVGRAFRHEIRTIFHDPGVILFFFVLPLAYPVVYTLIYNPEVVRELPVAVVDNSRTPESRLLVREAAASPAIAIYDYCSNMAEAKELMAQGKVFGILEIPSDYARNIGRGEQANVSFFADMSLLLRYRTFVGALTDVQLKVIGDITATRIAEMGAQSLAGDSRMPVNSESNFLGDSEQGFASFVIPGIVILILQQSMLLGICLIGGTAAERRRANGGADPSVPACMP